MMVVIVCACVLPAFLISWSATWLMRWLAPRWGLVDQPAARKVHSTPTPLGGGVAIYLGFVIPVLAALLGIWWLASNEVQAGWVGTAFHISLSGALQKTPQLWAILGGGSLLMAMGLLDDRVGLPWTGRLAVQFLIACALVAGGIRGTLFIEHPVVGAGLTVCWIVVLINSLNFLDNMDGLCGGIGLVASLLFAWVMLQMTSEPRWLVGGTLLVLAGSIAGFLCHNWTPARIFMGDAGSTLIGMLLASMTVLGTFYDPHLPQRHVLLAPILVLAIPLYDFLTVIGIRLRSGKSPFQPDRNHFSHRLTDLGLSRRNAVLTVHFATLTTGLGALLLYQVRDWQAAMLVVSLVLCLLVIVSILEQAGRRNSRRLSAQAEALPPAPGLTKDASGSLSTESPSAESQSA
jgi:UDP-GlcNAc:undecaprenyl-phosphate GlcNAc-1-phosphate transferase